MTKKPIAQSSRTVPRLESTGSLVQLVESLSALMDQLARVERLNPPASPHQPRLSRLQPADDQPLTSPKALHNIE